MHTWLQRCESFTLLANHILSGETKEGEKKSSKAIWNPLTLFQSWNVTGNGKKKKKKRPLNNLVRGVKLWGSTNLGHYSVCFSHCWVQSAVASAAQSFNDWDAVLFGVGLCFYTFLDGKVAISQTEDHQDGGDLQAAREPMRVTCTSCVQRVPAITGAQQTCRAALLCEALLQLWWLRISGCMDALSQAA